MHNILFLNLFTKIYCTNPLSFLQLMLRKSLLCTKLKTEVQKQTERKQKEIYLNAKYSLLPDHTQYDLK